MASIDEIATLATFGSVWALLSVGHSLADHVIGQTDRQAAGKAAPSAAEIGGGVSPRMGWGTCLRHVASLGVARSSSPGSTMIVQLRRVCPRSLGERQVSWTEAVAS
ncbi:hypothetical protein [Streptomyces sp. NPDC002994]|uniref:hypothetical protein n=1 Tax=Streptomyces sp. NPDC002994 TaxID=3154441 RepID=UPI0033B63391